MTRQYTSRPLDADSWHSFAELVERNNGVYGGCWCLGHHPEAGQRGISRRAVKEDRVRTGRAHAALVLDEEGVAEGWCPYGSPEELPAIKHRREYGFSRGRQVGKHAWVVSRSVGDRPGHRGDQGGGGPNSSS